MKIITVAKIGDRVVGEGEEDRNCDPSSDAALDLIANALDETVTSLLHANLNLEEIKITMEITELLKGV